MCLFVWLSVPQLVEQVHGLLVNPLTLALPGTGNVQCLDFVMRDPIANIAHPIIQQVDRQERLAIFPGMPKGQGAATLEMRTEKNQGAIRIHYVKEGSEGIIPAWGFLERIKIWYYTILGPSPFGTPATHSYFH